MVRVSGLFLILTLSLSMTLAAKPEPVTLEMSTYQQLSSLVREHQAQGVLIYIWGEFCLPCKKKIPDFLALHRKYEGKGFFCMSVSVDPFEDAEAVERLQQFLEEKKMTCRNLLLKEKVKVWQEKLQVLGPPSAYLFNRQGKLVQRWDDKEVDFARIDERIAQLLKSQE